MPSDHSQRLATAPPPQWKLPDIEQVTITAAPYRPRAGEYVPHPHAPVEHAIAIVVSLAAPLPIRALGPVLWVGEERLTESESVDGEGKTLRFWGLHPEKLTAGAAIRMSWVNEPPPAVGTKAKKFVYKRPG